MNILISSASRNVNYIKAFKNALNEEGGGTIISIDSSPYSVGLMYSDISYIVPRSIEPNFINKVFDICKKNNVKLIIPNRDEELMLYAKYKKDFLKIGTNIMVASCETIMLCQDKKRFIEFCKENNFNVPKTYSLSEIKNKDISFPLFIKERIGKSSKNTFKIENIEQLNSVIGLVKEPIIQKFTDKEEYSIDLFADFDGNIISVVPRIRISVFGGECFIGKTVNNNIIKNECIRLAKKLKLIGHNTIQCFFDGKLVEFIEVNPRFGGASILSIAAGANTPLYLIKLIKGESLKQNLNSFKDNFVMMRFIEDIFVSNDEILHEVVNKND